MDRMHLLLHTVNYMYPLSLDVTGQIYWLTNLVYSINPPKKREAKTDHEWKIWTRSKHQTGKSN